MYSSACGVSHQAVSAIDSKGDNILIQGKQWMLPAHNPLLDLLVSWHVLDLSGYSISSLAIAMAHS